MGKKPNEYRFEEWIEISLKNSGYQSKLYSEYDRDLCLIKDDVISGKIAINFVFRSSHNRAA